jgi:hypothetical protein
MEPLEAVENLRETLPADICDKMEGTVQQALVGVIDAEMAFAVTFKQICKGIPADKKEDPEVAASLRGIYSGVIASYEQRHAGV